MPRVKRLDWRGLRNASLHSDGLASFRGLPNLMDNPHRHNELEFNFLETGGLSYQFDSERLSLDPRHLYVFWAGLSHQVVQILPGTTLQWVTIPLPLCLEWSLPKGFLQKLLFSQLLVEPNPLSSAQDQHLLQRWHGDLQSRNPETKEVLLLELQARLRRLALDLEGTPLVKGAEARLHRPLGGGSRELGQLILYINENFLKPIRINDMAAAAQLRPNQAMRLFRHTFGSSLMAYVMQLRLMHARRLLRASNAKVIDIAHEAGFGSLSNFYEIFEKSQGQSPGTYRRSLLERG